MENILQRNKRSLDEEEEEEEVLQKVESSMYFGLERTFFF
jgi:hypothetical protein